MKSTKLYGWTLLSLVFMVSCLFYACKRDNTTVPNAQSANADGMISAVDPCSTCSNENMYKTAGNNNEVIGTVAICQTLTELTLTFAVSGTDARFSKTGYGIYTSPPLELNPSPSLLEEVTDHTDVLRTFSYTIPLSSLGDPLTLVGTTIHIATYAVVPGGGGGMVWAGSLLPAANGNPNSRYFNYTIKACETPEPPTAGCYFSQGYWFAKPNGSQWSETEIMFGGQPYTYSAARAIFFGSNSKTGKTDAKQAFLQGLAYKLSEVGGADGAGVTACNGADDALLRIEAYFSGLAVKQTAKTINTYVTNVSLRADATLLSNCIGAHHCNSTANDAALK